VAAANGWGREGVIDCKRGRRWERERGGARVREERGLQTT
jgi:hypothetical protein